MKFPKQELDIDEYLGKIKTLLEDSTCHIFIDTNIISQLYRLNEHARNDFYTWVNSCKDRFHIPNWSVHEYSKQFTTQKTKDYLPELSKATTISNELSNISRFVKGYVGDSLLIGSEYAGDKEKLFKEIDAVSKEFSKIATAINKNLPSHQQNVHKEMVDQLEQFTIGSDVYEIIRNLKSEHELRFKSELPPGFKDSDKTSNPFGDLIIWKEIIEFCKKTNPEQVKAIFITRDSKPDMVYRPVKQKRDNNPNVKDQDKVAIAQESLVYEFKLATGSDDFYLIDFYTLVRILSYSYRELALSFQIATEQENALIIEDEISCIANKVITDEETVRQEKPDENKPESEEDVRSVQVASTVESNKYSGGAIIDDFYDITKGVAPVNECIDDLKSYNWYVQNPAIDKLSRLSFNNTQNTQQNRDSFFVLGRNILQSADGASGSAVYFIENLRSNLSRWPKPFQEAFIDGCLYEVFFDSSGRIRLKAFKASYFDTLLTEVNKMNLKCPFGFINEELKRKNEGRFVPEVNSDKKYKFEFSFYDKNESDLFNEVMTKSLKIEDKDVSDTFKTNLTEKFSDAENIENKLSEYYAIPVKSIELITLPEDVKSVYYIVEENNNVFSPF